MSYLSDGDGSVSAFGTHYDSVVDFAAAKLPPVPGVTEDDMLLVHESSIYHHRSTLPKHSFIKRSQMMRLKTNALPDFRKQAKSTLPVQNPRTAAAVPSDVFVLPTGDSLLSKPKSRGSEGDELQWARPPPRMLQYASITPEPSDEPTAAEIARQTRAELAYQRLEMRHEQELQWRRRRKGAWDAGAWSIESLFYTDENDELFRQLLDEKLSTVGAGSTDEVASQLAKRRASLSGESPLGTAQPGAGRRGSTGRRGSGLLGGTSQGAPEWLEQAHRQLDIESKKDEEARRLLGPPSPTQVQRIRAMLRSDRFGDAMSEVQLKRFSDDDLVWREQVRRTPYVQKLLRDAFGFFDRDGDGGLNYDEYQECSKALYSVLHTENDEEDAAAVARTDWVHDSMGEGRVGPERWKVMMMQLGDLWTTAVSVREYCSFFISVMLQVALISTRARTPLSARTGTAASSDKRAATAGARNGATRKDGHMAQLGLVDWRAHFDRVFADEYRIPPARGSALRASTAATGSPGGGGGASPRGSGSRLQVGSWASSSYGGSRGGGRHGSLVSSSSMLSPPMLPPPMPRRWAASASGETPQLGGRHGGAAGASGGGQLGAVRRAGAASQPQRPPVRSPLVTIDRLV